MKSQRLNPLLGTRLRTWWKQGQILALGLTLFGNTAFAGSPFSRIYTFGDSLSDTGNFFQMTGGLVPPAPYYYQGRVSNGPVWIEQLAGDLGMRLESEDQFATLGSMTGNENFRDGFLGNDYPGFLDQMDAFFELQGSRPLDPNALYVIWIGANDFIDWLQHDQANPALIPSLIVNGVTRTAGSILRLAQGGARHILVVNIPDLGLTPDIRMFGPEIAGGVTALSQAYNAELDQQLDALAYAGIPTIRVDAAQIIRDIVEDPAAFGLTNVTDRAILGTTDADSALFWDGIHPTTAGHAIVAERALAEMITYFSPRKGKGNAPGPVQALNGLTKKAAH
jgi:phospholipase/lecithinase/hemolysin